MLCCHRSENLTERKVRSGELSELSWVFATPDRPDRVLVWLKYWPGRKLKYQVGYGDKIVNFSSFEKALAKVYYIAATCGQ